MEDRPRAYAGKTVEISIAYISDWGTQNLGVFLDDFALAGRVDLVRGTDTGGWQITGPPAGSGANANNFEIPPTPPGSRSAPRSATPQSLLMGYGFEGDLHRGRAQRGDGPGGLPAA